MGESIMVTYIHEVATFNENVVITGTKSLSMGNLIICCCNGCGKYTSTNAAHHFFCGVTELFCICNQCIQPKVCFVNFCCTCLCACTCTCCICFNGCWCACACGCINCCVCVKNRMDICTCGSLYVDGFQGLTQITANPVSITVKEGVITAMS